MQDLIKGRNSLETFWQSRPHKNIVASELCAEKWNKWSPSVRKGFVKRAATVILGTIQTGVPRKQWAQWESTAKFCMDDFFSKARECCEKKFEDGLKPLIQSIVNGNENKEEFKFNERVKDMLKSMKNDPSVTNNLPNFNPDDQAHETTLGTLRSSYSIQWASYIIARLVEQNE